MITGQIGEDADVESECIDPALLQCMTGHFHDGTSATVILHRSQEPGQIVPLRSGQRGCGSFTTVVVADAADEPTWFIGRTEQMMQNDRGRRFSVRSRDADQGQGSGRMIMQPVGDVSGDRYGVGAFDGGTTCPPASFRIAEDAGGSGLFGRFDMVTPIEVFAGTRQEDHARAALAGILDQTRDGASGIDTVCRDGQLIQKFVQCLQGQSVA